ncbi:hypothetical protein EDB89DRAFT_1915183 [Lactarius sanguifluus]|nr:hypothetical protein EDB89DRAFT_1915183 [Lactarius sanguifluus]
MACNTPTHHHPDPNTCQDPATSRKTLPTCHAASTRCARPRQPATPPQHDAQEPRHTTLNAARKAPAATDPHATPTRRATSHHMPSHHHTKTLPPPTRHVAPMWRATPRRPITTLTPSTPSALPPPYQ